MNCYNMLQLLRDNIGEATAAHWSDVNLIHRLNAAQRMIAQEVSMMPGGWLVKSTNLTPSASVITLPDDCSKPLYLEETSDGTPLRWLESVRTRRVSRRKGIASNWEGSLEVYPLRNTLVVNQDSYTTGVTLWYEIRVPDLIAGTASAGGVASLTLPVNGNVKHIDDYYNNVEFQAESGTGAGTVGDSISDYAGATGACTVTGTYDATTVFGTISMLPEECWPVIVLDATVAAMAKPSSNLDEQVFMYYSQERRRARKQMIEWLETRIKGHGRVTITEENI